MPRWRLEKFFTQNRRFKGTIYRYRYRDNGCFWVAVQNVRECCTNELVTDHVWIPRAIGFLEQRVVNGDVVEFLAYVGVYGHAATEAHEAFLQYGLYNPRSVRVL